jgi:hypothetical protein
MHIGTVLVAASFLSLSASSGRAQTPAPPDTSAEKPAEWLIGMSLGVPGSQHNVYPDLFTIGLQFTQVRAGRIGGDIAIGTMPYLFANGMFPFGFRGNVTVPLVTPHLIVLPTAGVSGVVAMAPGGAGGLIGVNGGIAAVVRSHGLGLRAGITWHKFEGATNPIWLLEVGFVSIGIDPP